jgi:hypothetical protein
MKLAIKNDSQKTYSVLTNLFAVVRLSARVDSRRRLNIFNFHLAVLGGLRRLNLQNGPRARYETIAEAALRQDVARFIRRFDFCS